MDLGRGSVNFSGLFRPYRPRMRLLRGKFRCFLLVLAAHGVALSQRLSQEPVRQLGGSLAFGWLDSYSRDSFQVRRKNPFVTARFDFQSYLFDPDFISYRIQPRFSSGFQDAFTGMSDGSGVAVETVFLRRRPWPLRFRYSRFQRSLWTTGLSVGYGRTTYRNEDSALGVQWQLLLPKLPKLELNFDRADAATAPEAVLGQGFDSKSRTGSIHARDKRWGWAWNGSASIQNLDSHYVIGRTEGPLIVENRNRIENAIVMAQRNLRDDLSLMVTANRTSNRTDFERGIFDQSFQSAGAKLDYRPAGRLQAWAQARQTSTSLESTPIQMPGATPIQLPSAGVRNRMVDGDARFEFAPGAKFFGRAEYTDVQAPKVEGVQQSGNFVNTGGGVLLARRWKSVTYGGSYYLYTTRSNFVRGSGANIWGHALDSSVSAGDPSRVRISAVVLMSRSLETVRTFLPYVSSSQRIQGTIARTFFRAWTLEVQGAVAQTHYDRQSLRSDFAGRDYGASLTGPRTYLGFTRSVGSGNSYQSAIGILPLLSEGPLPPALIVIGSSNSFTMANASWNLSRQISIRGVWRGQIQTVGSLLSSRFEQKEATFNWQFRKVRFEAGFLAYRFDFGLPIIRRSILFRVTRDFQVF